MPHFLENIGDFNFKDNGFMILMDRKGTILSHPANIKVLHSIQADDPLSQAGATRAMEMQSGFGRAALMGVDGFVAYFPVPGRDLTVMATLPYKTFMEPANKLRNMLLTLTLTVLLATVILSLFISGKITKRILRLTHALQRCWPKGICSTRWISVLEMKSVSWPNHSTV